MLIIFSLFISGCSQIKQNTDTQETTTQLANPASTFCIENNGQLEIRTALDGSQTGYCIFDNGKECEEWEYFRGECSNE